MSSQEQQQEEKPGTFVWNHECYVCKCPKKRYYDRGKVFSLRGEGTLVYHYHAYTCASCSTATWAEVTTAGGPQQ